MSSRSASARIAILLTARATGDEPGGIFEIAMVRFSDCAASGPMTIARCFFILVFEDFTFRNLHSPVAKNSNDWKFTLPDFPMTGRNTSRQFAWAFLRTRAAVLSCSTVVLSAARFRFANAADGSVLWKGRSPTISTARPSDFIFFSDDTVGLHDSAMRRSHARCFPASFGCAAVTSGSRSSADRNVSVSMCV